ncbi:hypothetical protein TL16_g13218, partial [Triparma laevis f. inornata]
RRPHAIQQTNTGCDSPVRPALSTADTSDGMTGYGPYNIGFDDQGQVTGRLEYKVSGVWGTVGDKDTNTHRFGEKEAQVACRQLGLETGYGLLLNSSFVPSSDMSSGYLTPFLDDLNCDPVTDLSLGSCTTGSDSTDVDSSNSYDIGVMCKFAECEMCEHGKYSETLRNKECQNCEAGTYNPKNTSMTKSDCLKCESDSYSSPGSMECSPCPAELVQGEDGGSCVCKVGSEPNFVSPMGYLEYPAESTIRLSRGYDTVQPPSFSSDGTVYGRLEIKDPSSADREWGTVSGKKKYYSSTSDSWVISSYGALPNIETAVVACKQLAKELGYYSDPLSAEVLHYDDDRVIEGYLAPVLTEVDCETTNSAIRECSYNAGGDSGGLYYPPVENDYDIGVQCKILSYADSCEICIPGKISIGAANSLCADCPKNHYNPSYGATSCDECKAAVTMFGPEGSSSDSMCFTEIGLWSNLYIADNWLYKINDDVETFSKDSNGNWLPESVSFVSRDKLLALNNYGSVYEYSSESMARLGTFASISNKQDDTSVLYLDHHGLVAVGALDGIYFFALEDGLGGGNLEESSHDRFIDFANPRKFCLGEFENEILIMTNIDSDDKITRKCIPGMSCSSEREGVIVSTTSYSSTSFYDVAVLKEKRVILVTIKNSNSIYSVRSCPLSGSEMDLDTDCSLPHVAFQVSKIQTAGSDSKAGSIIEIPLDLNDHRNNSLSDEFDFADISSKITVRAEGYVQTIAEGLSVKIEIDGDVEHSGTSMTAKLGINFAGLWQVHVSGEISGSQVEFMNSPFNLTVEPDVTDASKTEVDFTSEIVAGNEFEGRYKLYDAYQNPTSFSRDRLFAELKGYSGNSLGSLVKSSNGFWEYSTSQNLTKAGTYTLEVTLGSEEHIYGSPFQFDVVADVPDPSKCGSSMNDMGKEFFSSGSTFTGTMMLKVTPRDQYDNLVLDAEGFEARTELPIAEESETVIEVGILYNGEFLEGSPKVITVKPDDGSVDLPAILGGNLHESLRKKKHSEKEIDIMKKAMEDQGKERSDELRQVLIPSSEVKIVSLLGQGAFGTVNLGTYKDQEVAIKQLISIDEESVQRFRFECFLMKELRHPNVVKLVGVCWDDMMLGCVLEYIDGGSLEGRLKKDWIQPTAEKMTWKRELLSLAKGAANGVRYLHNSRYYDEEEQVWKDCIIHRDLKPDNMLVTKDNVLKLTDFGEARAADLSMTMTAVGTPIYISPEVMRNDRYDLKADTYSFGVVLAAMVRAEKNIVDFFFDRLQKKMGKKNRMGIGIGSLNRYLDRGWRPPLPVEFYPKLTRLISRCWAKDPTDRPDFEQIYEELSADMLESGRRKNEDLAAENEKLTEELQNLKQQLNEGGGGEGGGKAQPTIVDFGAGKQKQKPTIVKFEVENGVKEKQQPPIVDFGVEDQKVGMVGGAVGIKKGGTSDSTTNENKEGEAAPNPFANIFYSG